MVFDNQAEYPSQWAAINSITGKIGRTGGTLRSWVRQAELDQGLRGGPTTEDSVKFQADTLIQPACLLGPKRDLVLTGDIQRLFDANFDVNGVHKV